MRLWILWALFLSSLIFACSDDFTIQAPLEFGDAGLDQAVALDSQGSDGGSQDGQGAQDAGKDTSDTIHLDGSVGDSSDASQPPPYDSGCGPAPLLPNPQCQGQQVMCEHFDGFVWGISCRNSVNDCQSFGGVLVECRQQSDCTNGKSCFYNNTLSGSTCSNPINNFAGTSCLQSSGNNRLCQTDLDCKGSTHCLPVQLQGSIVVPFGLCL